MLTSSCIYLWVKLEYVKTTGTLEGGKLEYVKTTGTLERVGELECVKTTGNVGREEMQDETRGDHSK